VANDGHIFVENLIAVSVVEVEMCVDNGADGLAGNILQFLK